MLSQQEVADRAGTSLFTIQRIERGEGNVRPKTGRGVAAALGVPIEELLPKVQAPLFRELPESALEDERRGYPYPWMTGALARVIEGWRHIVEDPSKRGPAHTKEDPAYSRAIYRRAIATACFDVIASVVLIEWDTGHSGEEWDRLPENEKRERLQVAKQIEALARQALAQYKASEAAQEAEVVVLERRREEIRRRTAEISA
jgi:transcriptional regulator with XRE-family HTH domain